VLLSFVPVSKTLMNRYQMRQKGELTLGPLDRLLGRIGKWIVGNGKYVVVALTVFLVSVSYYYARKIEVGDFVPGSSILWPTHRYNKDALRIAYSMPLLNPIYIIMKAGDMQWDLVDTNIIQEIDRFKRYLARHPRILFAQSIIDTIPVFSSGTYDGDPNYFFLPKKNPFTPDAPAFDGRYLKSMLQSARPGDYDRLVSHNLSAANLIIYCRDKMPKTLKSVLEHINSYLEKVKLAKGEYLLAGGALGVQAAIRDEIASVQTLNLSLALLGLFIFCSINFRSLAAGLILTVPLAISNIITFALMGAYQIGLTVNTYPISSIGIGLGVDYGIYLVSRVLEEQKTAPDLQTAIVRTITTNGKAVTIIASTLTIGLILWLFSALKFQAEMGALLAIVLFFNMLGALFLIPSFIAIFKPKFILKKTNRGE
jgi:hypothetical protein